MSYLRTYVNLKGNAMRRFTAMTVLAAAAVASALILSPGAASAARGTGGPVMDARAMASSATPSTKFAEDSFFSGEVAPGGSQSWVWNNAGLNIAYRVGLSPVGASTAAACRFEVTDQSYERLRTGERKFYFTIKNTGGIACGTTILISAVSASVVNSTGGMEAGEIKTFDQLNVDESAVQLLGLVPSGATSANTCQFKVLRTWLRRTRQGDVSTPVHLRYQVQNTGSIACTADVEMGSAPVQSRLTWRTLNAGSSLTITWNNANPTSATHLIGVEVDEIGCAMEITRSWYRQVVNSNGSIERELQMVLRNAGTIQCTARPTLSRI
jgi:hypothetical protein